MSDRLVSVGPPGSTQQDRSNTRILTARFNQEASCIAVGTTSGVRVLNCQPFSKCYEYSEGAVSLVEMLFCTSLVCFVGAGEQANMSPRQLRIFDTKKNKNICELNMLSTVINVKLNYARVICVLEKSIHIFDMSTMKILHTIDTIFNPTGICTLSTAPASAYMCYPASEEKGEIFVYDALNLRVITYICAHNTPIRCCSLNAAGTMLATCSNKGTVIRVYSIPAGKKLYSFRRGTYPAKVNTINFNRKSDMLVVSSTDSSTVHVFSMREHTTSPTGVTHPHPLPAPIVDSHYPSSPASTMGPSGPSSFLGTSTAAAGAMLKTVANSSAVTLARGGAAAAAAAGVSGALSFLPNLLQDMVEPSRNFAYINLKDAAIPSVVAFGRDDEIQVVTTTGYFSVYSIPSLHSGGGQCKLESEHALLDQPSEAMGAKIMGEDAQQQARYTSPPVIQEMTHGAGGGYRKGGQQVHG